MLVDDDVKAGTRLPDDHLKRLSEAKVMTGEVKYGAQFTFRATALPVLLCNRTPSLADLSYGMQRRLLVIPFDRSFKGKAADKELFDRIWAKEGPGVLNRALQGLQRLVHRGWYFNPPGSVQQATEQLLTEANPVPAFIAERCVEGGKAYLADLYGEFGEWCQASGITRTQQAATFKHNLLDMGYKSGRGNQGIQILGLKLAAKSASHRV